jgi:hypothetical protein
VLPSAIGAVVDGVLTTSHTPLSGHFSPVLAKVPIGFFLVNVSIAKKLTIVHRIWIPGDEIASN